VASVVAGLVLLALQGAAVADEQSLLDRVPLPPDARLHLVSHDLLQNGRRMAVATFVASSSVDDTIDWYKARWPADEHGPGHVETRAGGWRIVSHLEQGSNIALQLKPSDGDGSRGLLSVVPLDEVTTAFDVPLLPPGATLLSDTRSRQVRGEAVTQVVHAPGGTGEVAGFYRDRLTRSGWSVRHSDPSDGPAVLLFTSKWGLIEVVVTPHVEGGALVVMNRVTEG